MKEYEAQNPAETEYAVGQWFMGDTSKELRESLEEDLERDASLDPDYQLVDTMITNIEGHQYETFKLLEMWFGYIQASEAESQVYESIHEDEKCTVSAEDFILATYIVLKED